MTPAAEKGFRIAMVGSHSTGKTTLLNHLRNRCGAVRLVTIEEIARRLIALGFPMGKNTVVDSWVSFIDEQLRQERVLNSEPFDLLVSDRTVMDAAAYSLVNRSLPRPFIPPYFVSMVREIAFREAGYYDLYAYCPIEFAMHADGIRDEDEEYRSDVDRAVRQLLEEAGLDFVVLTGSVEERFDTLLSRLPAQLRVTLAGAENSLGDRGRTTTVAEESENPLRAEAELLSAGYGDVLESLLFKRLAGVSFLGILDYVYGIREPSNRREHSIAVAHIALQLARKLECSAEETETFVLANLLHDVGHAPFSHNSEPFLLEARNVYHYGLLTTYLRYGAGTIGEQYSISNLLKHRGAAQRDATSQLLMKKANGTIPLLQSLFTSPLNCDKVEGNYRTLRLLGEIGVEAKEMLACFERRGDDVVVPENRLGLVEQFWLMEMELYWKLIYTTEVFAGEAMLTRCLTEVFNTDERVTAFALSTDAEVCERIQRHRVAGPLLARLQAKNLFVPLSLIDPTLHEAVRGRMAPARFDRVARTAIERDVAIALGIEPEAVISHYSRRKHFTTDMSGLRQQNLFREHPDALLLSEVNAHLSSTKLSGDLFEVFCGSSPGV
jgi:HD superfamily phosphohydrolase/nicotinamide riboside kinase